VAVKRLPVYLRVLGECAAAGLEIVSSAELARRTGFSSEQIRKDLGYLGGFGTRGVGYATEALQGRIRRVLGLDRDVSVALVGAGHLGTALARYNQGRHQHVHIAAIFDADPAKVGEVVGGVRVRPVSELRAAVAEAGIRMGVIAVPAGAAQEVAEALVEAGVEAILNFAPVKLAVPPRVQVQNIDLSLELQALAYYTSGTGEAEEGEGDVARARAGRRGEAPALPTRRRRGRRLRDGGAEGLPMRLGGPAGTP
jgi:redox-sensing transcriptional repressor